MSRRSRVNFPVFGYSFHVLQVNNIQRTGMRLGVDLKGAYGAFVTQPDKDMQGWLVFDENADAGIVAHEAAHAIRQMFEDLGVGIDDENFAYHLHHLISKLHKFLKI